MNQLHAINIQKTCTYTPWEYVIDSGDVAGPNFWCFLEGVDVDAPGLYGGRTGEPPIPAAAGMVTRFLMVTNRWWTILNVVHLPYTHLLQAHWCSSTEQCPWPAYTCCGVNVSHEKIWESMKTYSITHILDSPLTNSWTCMGNTMEPLMLLKVVPQTVPDAKM